MESSSRNPAPRTGKLLIVGLAVLGGTFFGLLQYSKRLVRQDTSAKSSVIVLPSKVFGTADKIFLTDAVPASLSTLLHQVPGLDTRTPPESFGNEHLQDNLAGTANEFHASTIVTSTVTAEGTDLTINVQLLNPQSGAILWSRQCAGQLRDYNELLRQAAEGVGHALQPEAPRVSAPTGLAATSEAELANREGEYYFDRYNKFHESADSNEALKAFRLAFALDPALASAAARISLLSPGT
jgi:TolB-like protein